jgi:type IV pilus assembly protein PilA
MKSMKKGFTLVELMVVIVIIGILAALAIPRFLGASNKAKATEFKPVMKQIYTLNEALKQERDVYGGLDMIGFEAPKGNSSKPAYFTYDCSLGTDDTSSTGYTATATLAQTIGPIASGREVTMAVNNAGAATNDGDDDLQNLANWH